MAALAALLPDLRSLSRADKLRPIQLLAEDLVDAAGPAPAVSPVDRPPHLPGPRLAQPDRAADFVKRVSDVHPDAAV